MKIYLIYFYFIKTMVEMSHERVILFIFSISLRHRYWILSIYIILLLKIKTNFVYKLGQNLSLKTNSLISLTRWCMKESNMTKRWIYQPITCIQHLKKKSNYCVHWCNPHLFYYVWKIKHYNHFINFKNLKKKSHNRTKIDNIFKKILKKFYTTQTYTFPLKFYFIGQYDL